MRGLRAKLWIGFGGLLLILLVVSALSIVVLTRYSRALERVFRENYNSAVYCQQMKRSLDELNTRAERLLWSDAEGVPDEASAILQFESNLNHQLSNVTLPGERELTDRLATLWEQYKQEYRRFDSTGVADLRQMYSHELLPRYDELKRVAERVADMNMSNMVSVDGNVKRTLLSVRRALLVLLIVGIAVAASLVAAVGATILRPLHALIRAARQIETGNLDLSVPVNSRDEIGQLIEAFNAMALRLRELRRLDDARLARTQRTTQLAIDSLPDAVFVISPKGQIEISNQTAGKHFGITPGKCVSDLGLRWLSELHDRVKATRKPFEPEGYKAAIQFFDAGRERFGLPRAEPMLDDRGELIGITVILVDVTALRHADELKSGLVSTVSHELRTPLTALRMAVLMLDEQKVGALTPRQTTLLQTARVQSERLYQIIDNLLDMSRIESGRAQFEFRRTSPAEIVHAAVEPFRQGFAEKKVRLEVDLPDQMPEVVADLTYVGHALGNLVSNALKFTPAGSRVGVAALVEADFVSFVVSDAGPGIPDDCAGRIFEKFFRMPRQSGPAGIGLGLAIAKEIAEAHGGRISFQNRAGGGAEFRLTLPRASAPTPVIAPLVVGAGAGA